jgi:activator of 2-hydroxyglutaryl-CoA dehydratase
MQELTALILAGGVGFFLGNLWYSHQERNSSDAKKDKTHLRNMDTNNDKEIYVGIDLGGTTVGVALINSFGKILNTTSCNIADSNRLRCGAANTKSPAKIQKNSNVNSRSFDNVVALIVVLIHEAMQSSTVQDLELSQIAGF